MRIRVAPDVVLRSPTEADALFFATIENCPVTKQYLGGPSGHSQHQYKEFLATRDSDDCQWLVVCDRNGSPFGRCGLFAHENEIELHIALLPAYGGAGIGRTVACALIRLSAQRFPNLPVCAKVHPNNTAARRLVETLKFAHQSTVETGREKGHGWYCRHIGNEAVD